MEHPKDVGDQSQLAIMLASRRAGYAVYTPYGENTRCDLVIDLRGELRRVQCKTGRLRCGAIRFATCSTYAHHKRTEDSRDYLGEIDYFAVYCRETAGVYLVPIDEVAVRRAAALRVDPSRNGQVKRVRPARAYEIGRVSF